MDLIDEQNVARRKVRQQRGEVACLFNGRAGRDAQIDAHLVGDDAGQRRLAESRRAVEQHVIERFAPPPRGLDVDGEVSLRLLLSGVVGQRPGPEAHFSVVLWREAGRHNRGLVFLRKIKAHFRPSLL